MDGKNSDLFRYYKLLLERGFNVLKKYVDEIVNIILIMQLESDLYCFKKFDIVEFRERFLEGSTDKEVK
jgi:phosphatidylinositol 4-kinase